MKLDFVTASFSGTRSAWQEKWETRGKRGGRLKSYQIRQPVGQVASRTDNRWRLNPKSHNNKHRGHVHTATHVYICICSVVSIGCQRKEAAALLSFPFSIIKASDLLVNTSDKRLRGVSFASGQRVALPRRHDSIHCCYCPGANKFSHRCLLYLFSA